ncbi:MAG: Heimdall-CTERM domain-containing surface protein, partial [Candidatus Hodarchaeota archaeon]
VTLPPMAFFVGDDAKMRMKIKNDFGLTVLTATNWYDVKVVEQTFTTHVQDTGSPIELKKDGNVFFWTSFKEKDYYYLRELNFPPYNIDPTTKRDVYVQMFIPTPAWGITDVAIEYFAIEIGLAFGFTKFVATKIAPEILYPGSGTIVVNRFLYLTLVEFPEWLGGEIYHDPAYSAVAAVAAVDDGDTDTQTGDVPGFEFLTIFLAIPALYALYRKRR